MGSFIEPISKELFNSLVDVKFNTINEGFDNYTNGVLEINQIQEVLRDDENKFINFIKKAFKENEGEVLIDFYLSKLNDDEILKLRTLLNEEDEKILLNCINEKYFDTVYFKVKSINIIPFITRLNTRALFFCTIYFTKIPLTVWGNYDMKFPIFTKCKADIEFYKNLAFDIGIDVNNISIK